MITVMDSEKLQQRRRRLEVSMIEGFRDGDEAIQRSFYALMRETFEKGSASLTLLSDYDRDDLFQDSFLILWEKIDSRQIFVECGEVVVSTSAGTVPVESLPGYFMRIVRNKYFLLLRGRSQEARAAADGISTESEAFATLFWDEDPEIVRDRIVADALTKLPRSCVDLLVKFYLETKTLSEILEERGENASYDGLKSRKSKCLAALRQRVAEGYRKLRR